MQMYKKRLKQWGITKTIPSSQKDAFVRIAQDCIRKDEALPTHDLEGRPIDWYKVRRRDWESGVRQRMWLNVELPAKPSAITRPITSREPTELLVYSITDCIRSQPSGSSRALLAGRFEMPVLFEDAIQFVEDGYEHSARRKFEEAGVMAQKYLQSVPLSLLPQLLRVILDLNWKVCPAHQRLVFEFLQRICVQSLGSDDMLTKFVALLMQQDATQVGREAVWSCVLHSLSQKEMDASAREELQARYRWAMSRWRLQAPW